MALPPLLHVPGGGVYQGLLSGVPNFKRLFKRSPFALNFQHHNFADIVYAQTVILHTNY